MSPYDLGAIRTLVRESLTIEQIADLAFDHFPLVYNEFANGQASGKRVRMLVDYASRQRKLDALLTEVKRLNPDAFAEYEQQAGGGPAPGQAPPPAPVKESEGCEVLVLAANPKGRDALDLESEARFIRERLQEGEVGREYRVKFEAAARAEDLSKFLLRDRPLIVHFAGHGTEDGELLFEDESGAERPVSAEALGSLFAAVKGRVECVVLNACFSLERADALAPRVRCLIGMSDEIDDESAQHFAGGFYRGLAFGEDYFRAFEIGHAQIRILDLPDAMVPRFVTRNPGMFDPDNDDSRVAAVKRDAKGRTVRSRPKRSARRSTLYPLWFGTNRRPVDAANPSQGFTGDRDDRLHYGICEVAVPKAHDRGSVGSSWWGRLKKWADDRLTLDPASIALLEVAAWSESLRRHLAEREAGDRVGLVYIHGYNVSFEEAAMRAAQIGFDLRVPGITGFYSWPSKGVLAGYAADGQTIEASEKYLEEFLLEFSKSSGAEEVHIIAHSMGNQGLLGATERLVRRLEQQTRTPFGRIALAAPDVDRDVFLQLADNYKQVAGRTAIYASPRDKAVAASAILQDYPRAGLTPPYTVIPGIDTIEVESANISFLGHGYYAEAVQVLDDLSEFLFKGTLPGGRQGLRQTATPEGQIYWVV